MHCFVPSPLAVHSSSLQHSHPKRRRSTNKTDALSSASSLCAMSTSSSVSSLSTCASQRVTTATTINKPAMLTSPIIANTQNPVAKKSNNNNNNNKKVRFDDKVDIHPVPNMLRFRFPELIWWQPGELPNQVTIVRNLLDPRTNMIGFGLSSPHEQAIRVASATSAVLAAHAKRGGGLQSLRAQAGAARDYQSCMRNAAQWRGLEPLLVVTGVQEHVLEVLLAQRSSRQTKLEPSQAILEAARIHSRPSAHLALERARFDAKYAGRPSL